MDKKVVEQGFAPSMYNIGVLYQLGQCVAQNYTEAFKWYKKAAEKERVY